MQIYIYYEFIIQNKSAYVHRKLQYSSGSIIRYLHCSENLDIFRFKCIYLVK